MDLFLISFFCLGAIPIILAVQDPNCTTTAPASKLYGNGKVTALAQYDDCKCNCDDSIPDDPCQCYRRCWKTCYSTFKLLCICSKCKVGNLKCDIHSACKTACYQQFGDVDPDSYDNDYDGGDYDCKGKKCGCKGKRCCNGKPCDGGSGGGNFNINNNNTPGGNNNNNNNNNNDYGNNNNNNNNNNGGYGPNFNFNNNDADDDYRRALGQNVSLSAF